MDGFGGGGGRGFTITPTLGDNIAPNPIITYNGSGGGGSEEDFWDMLLKGVGSFGSGLKEMPWKDIFQGLGALGGAAAPFAPLIMEMFGGGDKEKQFRSPPFEGIPGQLPQMEHEPFDLSEMFAGMMESMRMQQEDSRASAEKQQADLLAKQQESEADMLAEQQKLLAQEAAGHRADFQAQTGSALTPELAAMEMGVPLEELLAALELFGADYGWDIGGMA